MIINSDAIQWAKEYKKNCLNCRYGGGGYIINNERNCICSHPWGETDPEKISGFPDVIFLANANQLRAPVLVKDLTDEIDCPNHEWDMFHPAKNDHQLELFKGS